MNSPTLTFSPELAASRSPQGGQDSEPSPSPKSNLTPADCSSSVSPASPTLDPSPAEPTLPGFAIESRSAPGDFPASPFPKPASKEAQAMCAGSGRQLLGLSKSSGPLGLLVKTLLG